MSFIEWLDTQAKDKGWTRAELAKRAGVSSTAIYRIANGDRKPGSDLCNGVARALHIPPAEVYRAAGLLPPSEKLSPLVEKVAYKTSRLPSEEDQLDVLAFIEMKEKRAEERERQREKERSASKKTGPLTPKA